MEIKKLQKKSEFNQNKKLIERLACFEKLINELEKKNLPAEIVNSINQTLRRLTRFQDRVVTC